MEAVYAQAQCIRKNICELCDRDTKVDFKCVNCQQILCFDCKNVHLRSKSSMDHEIDTLHTAGAGHGKVTDVIAEPSDHGRKGFHSDTVYCKLHPKRKPHLFCKDCSEVICKRCIITDHKEHTFCNLNEVQDSFATQLRENLLEIQSSKVSELEEKENILTAMHEKLDRSEKSVIRDIKQASKRLQTKVVQWEQNLLKLISERSGEEKKKLWNNKELICDELSNLDELQSQCLVALASNNAQYIFQVIKKTNGIEMDPKISEIENSDNSNFKFIEGTALKGDPQVSFGHVNFPGEENKTRHYREVFTTNPTVLPHPLSIGKTYEQAKTAF